MKKVVLLLLLLAGTFSLAFPQESGTCGENVVWTYSDGTLTIKPAEGTSGGAIKSYTYTEGDRPWDELDISKVIIEKGVTSIGPYAFYRCSGLTSLTIGKSVTTIWSNAFRYCSGLTSLTIPESVTSIEESAFSGCSSLTMVEWNAVACQDFSIYNHPFDENITSITFGNQVERIPDYLCYKMKKLTSVTIGESVTTIGQSAFSGCSGLTSLTIPESVTTIGQTAFSGCSGLTSLTIPESVTTIGNASYNRRTMKT